jgi:hypothetical protein
MPSYTFNISHNYSFQALYMSLSYYSKIFHLTNKNEFTEYYKDLLKLLVKIIQSNAFHSLVDICFISKLND